jgi:rSAM/selenodomain-associated transferase 2
MAALRDRAAVAGARWMTPPELSFIVPVLNEELVLKPALARLQPWRDIAEIIVVDGGSDDTTVALAHACCDQLVETDRGRARQMNAGANIAQGRYLFFLHADTRLPVEPAQLMRALAGQPGWGFFRVRLSGDGFLLRVIERFMNMRSALSQVATGDQLLFVERELFFRVGGFADVPLMEDVEICKRLRRETRGRRMDLAVETSSRRWEQRGVLKTVVIMWYLRFAYWLGVSPQRLARIYYGG